MGKGIFENEITDEAKVPVILNTSAIAVNNTYSFANNTLFYAFVNPTYYTYYFRLVRRVNEWLDGYVMDFHSVENGVFSTRLCSCIMKGLANQIVGKQITFKTDKESNEEIQYANKWAKRIRLRDSVKTLMTWCLNTGTAFLKLNKELGGDYWVEPVRLDFCLFQTDFRNRVIDFNSMIKHYVNTSNNKNTNNYFLVEHRFFKDTEIEVPVEGTLNDEKITLKTKKVVKRPYVEYKVFRYTGQVLTAELMSSELNTDKGIEWKYLSSDIQNMIKNDYGAIRINEPQPLPFTDTIGVWSFLNEGQDVSLPSSFFGNSLTSLIISDLMEYDLAFSWALRDKYNGKGQVAVPKSWNAGNVGNPTTAFSGLDQQGVIQEVAGLDPNKDRPFNYQFEMRSAEWQSALDNTLRKIATKIGISPRVLASYLDNSANQRTATEINEESDTASEWIETHRADYEDTLNEIINLVLKSKGYTNEVQIKFATPSLVNKDRIIQRYITLRDSGLVDDKTALKEIFPDFDEETINNYLESAKAQKEEEAKKMMSFSEFE